MLGCKRAREPVLLRACISFRMEMSGLNARHALQVFRLGPVCGGMCWHYCLCKGAGGIAMLGCLGCAWVFVSTGACVSACRVCAFSRLCFCSISTVWESWVQCEEGRVKAEWMVKSPWDTTSEKLSITAAVCWRAGEGSSCAAVALSACMTVWTTGRHAW